MIPFELRLIEENTVDYLGLTITNHSVWQLLVMLQIQHLPYSLNNFMNLMLCQAARSIPTVVGKSMSKVCRTLPKNIKENYGNIEWILTENGMGVEGEEKFRKDGVIQDDYRIDFVKDHLRELHRAIQDGANCKGYLIWTFIDCWSWLNGYKNRYGLVELDLESQKRTLKNPVIGLKN